MHAMTDLTTEFTPLAALAGGVMIGLAATLLMAMAGRVMGATGLLAGMVEGGPLTQGGWRLAVLLGMFSGPWAFWAIGGQLPEITPVVSPIWVVIGGLLVGAGASFGSGCTSGHGVCGLARLSPRSLVATLTFMVACGVTVFVIRHVIGG